MRASAWITAVILSASFAMPAHAQYRGNTADWQRQWDIWVDRTRQDWMRTRQQNAMPIRYNTARTQTRYYNQQNQMQQKYMRSPGNANRARVQSFRRQSFSNRQQNQAQTSQSRINSWQRQLDQYNGRVARNQSTAMRNTTRSGQTGQQKIHGELLGTRDVRLQGFRDSHKLAKVRTQDGRVARVDLGPSRFVERMNLGRGDRVSATVTRGMINGETVLLARSIQTPQRFMTVRRRANPQLQDVRGQVQSVRNMRIRGSQAPHMIALVTLPSGHDALVNMGPNIRPESGMRRGEQVRFLARPTFINGRQALKAEQLLTQDDVIVLFAPEEQNLFATGGRNYARR